MANKGSEWRKWDLHFHTPSSYDYADKSVTNQQIIDGLASHNVSVVAITDHHVIDVKRITELQRLGKEKGITILPGIEFLSDARGEEPIHFIAIFSEKSDIDFVWKQIESRTNISKIQGEGKKHSQVYCNIEATVGLIKNLGGIVTIHAGKKTNSMENITHSLPHGQAQKEDIAKLIDVFELGKEDDIAGYHKVVNPHLKKVIGKQIPLIICSDNHDIKTYTVKQNLWIKADPTFEGLKQILYEPEFRVRIQKDEPDFKEDKLIIEEVQFLSSDKKFTSIPIKLNKNLNVIIGGKSSGKSILLYNIAQTLLANKEFFKKENIEDKYKFRGQDSKFNFQIKTQGGFTQKLYRAIDENSILPEVKYIPQSYLVKLAEPEINRTGNELNKIVRGLINEDFESKSIYDNFITSVVLNDKRRETIIDSYFDIRKKINDLEGELKLKGNAEILIKNIEANTSRIEALNKGAGLTPEQIEQYKKIRKDLDDVLLKRQKADNDFSKIYQFNIEVIGALNSLKSKKELLNTSLENDTLGLLFGAEYSKLDGLVEDLTKFNMKFQLNPNNDFLQVSDISEIFTKIDNQREQLKTQLIPYQQNVDAQSQIEQITQSINQDKTSLQAIAQLKKEIDDNRNALKTEKANLFSLYLENYKCYEEVIEKLKNRTKDLEKDGLLIQGLVKFNYRKFNATLRSVSDGRRASYNSYRICSIEDSLSELKLNELIVDLKQIFSSIVESGDYALISRVDQRAAVKVLLDDYFFDYWDIEYKNDKLGKMSTGKASFVILMLIIGLSKSKAPILIDQPEDNLDNRSITSDLVEYLKNKKLDRQIILVTHNANIVVNADAENIIVANQRGQSSVETSSPFQFDYVNGALENSFPRNDSEKDLLKSMGIREHIAEIVEGGKEAFKKREEKYNFG